MKISPVSEQAIIEAAKLLRAGELVVLPTETVYGLAAIFSNVDAVRSIYQAKGRPGDNPLIVHVSSIDQAKQLCLAWSDDAQRLAESFWPGPLAMVLKKAPSVPDVVTAGKDTVAIRFPNHPGAQAVIHAVGEPIAMPSANPFMHISPTSAKHVESVELPGVTLVLDGGASTIGIESTVIDISTSLPRLLRLGHISKAELEQVLGKSVLDPPGLGPEKRSPGMYARHYAPNAKLILVDRLEPHQVGFGIHADGDSQIRMPADPIKYASMLYDAMHRLDQAGPATIYAESPPTSPEWDAVWDRLKKASTEEQ